MSWFRNHIPNRVVRIALLAGLAVAAVAVTGVLLARALDGDGSSAASATPAARSDAKGLERDKVRIHLGERLHLGEKVSTARLKAVRARRAVSHKTSEAASKRRAPSQAVSNRGAPPQAVSKSGARSAGSSSAASGWRLAAKPPNSQVDHSSAATTFRPDVPGRYVLVRDEGKRLEKGNRLEIDAAPASRLVCVNTRAWTGGDPSSAHIRVGGTDFQRSGAGLQVVVLSRTNLGQVPGITANQTFAQDSADYAKFLAKLDNSVLVFVSGTVSDGDRPTVWGPLARLGAADLPLPFPNSPIQFSFIGIPGLDKGQGWQAVDGNPTKQVKSWCDPSLTGEPTNNLSGWLTLDSTGKNYTYVAGDDVAVDTNAPAGPDAHSIKVGNQTYTIDLGHDSNGWHVLVLDRASLCPEKTDRCDPPTPMHHQGYAQDGFAAMLTALQPLAGNPDALMILAPFVGETGWASNANPTQPLVGVIRDFGGSVLAPGRAFEAADSRYALIGGGDRFHLPAGSAPPEASESFTGFGDEGHITGYLTRDNQNRYGPGQMQSAGDPMQGLRAIAFAPPSSWPEDTSSAAFAFLSGKLNYSVSADSPLGIRGQYDQDIDWDNSLTTLSQWKDWRTLSPDEQKDAGSDQGTYDQVFLELYHEIQQTSNVHSWIDQLQKVYLGDTTTVGLLSDRVANEITAAYPPPNKESQLGASLTHLFFGLASLLPEVGELFEVAGEALDVGLEIGREATGEPQDVQGQVFKTAGAMRDAALGFLSNSGKTLSNLAEIVSTDATKLAIVGKNTGPVDDPKDVSFDKDHPWAIHDGDLDTLQGQVSTGLTRWLMPSVVDAGFKVWEIQIPSSGGNIANGNDATPPTYVCGAGNEFSKPWHPFGALKDDRAWMKLSNGTQTVTLALAGNNHHSTKLEEQGDHAAPPSPQMLDTLFNVGSDDLGFNRAWYLEQGFGETVGNDDWLVDC